ARVCDRVCVISGGKVAMTGTPSEVFGRPQYLREMGLGVPGVTDVVSQLQGKGVIREAGVALTVPQAAEMLAKVLQ
nr:energy-coupling factor ABC transporter ATP-binding protein [Chloroflexota bacterium]